MVTVKHRKLGLAVLIIAKTATEAEIYKVPPEAVFYFSSLSVLS